ncbi:PssE/Cps14G family polysaccharide biosynthesis glycosyltransferase [Vibrio cyclitrophicus]
MKYKVFVTVGTTAFEGLVSASDELAEANPSLDFRFQISDGKVVPQNGRYFRFVDNIDVHYRQADVVITHSGAGSIYQLLELGKKIIIVPNFERVDKHQSDIAFFMEQNGYALVCWDVQNLETLIDTSKTFEVKEFSKTNFFKYDEIVSYITESVK